MMAERYAYIANKRVPEVMQQCEKVFSGWVIELIMKIDVTAMMTCLATNDIIPKSME